MTLAETVALDDAFPEHAADALAVAESFNKHLYRPAAYLHKWWARRSGTTFRHVLKQLVADPARRDYYAAGGLEGHLVLDPMAGGGTTLHEALRLDASVIGVDVDPIPILQTRAALRLAAGAGRRTSFEDFYETLRARLGALHHTTCPRCTAGAEVQFTLYGLRRACACGEAIVVDGPTLRAGGSRPRVELCLTCGAVSTGEHCGCSMGASVPGRIATKAELACTACGAPFRELTTLPFVQRYVPLVVVGRCSAHGSFFKCVDATDRALLAQAAARALRIDLGDRASFAVPGGPKSRDLHARGVRSFLDLFTPRQLCYLDAALAVLPAWPAEDRLWLALLVSTSLDFNCLLCGYKGGNPHRPGTVRHVFSHHAYSFPYTALENNPLFSRPTSGTLRRLFTDRVERARCWALAPVERRPAAGPAGRVTIHGEVDGGTEVSSFAALAGGGRRVLLRQADARRLPLPDRSVDHVVTDPPYFDSVQYSDLSAFFRVWLQRMLPEAADWSYSPSASAAAVGGEGRRGEYATALAAIWQECARVLKRPQGRLIFTFHHWRPQAWAELTLALKRANFALVGCYVVAAENPSSVHVRALNALTHDAILVLAPACAAVSSRVWPEPARVSQDSSAAFCRACGAALGWCLAQHLDDEAIYALWARILAGPPSRPNGTQPSIRYYD